MKGFLIKAVAQLISGALCLAIGGTLFSRLAAQEQKVTQTAGVDNTKMGTYRALAELSFQAFQKGDSATAAKLARILERAWDKSEEVGGEKALDKTNPQQFEQIDRAMDVFIKPLIGYGKVPPDPTAVQAAYNDYLEKLKLAD